jgi:regulatory protein
MKIDCLLSTSNQGLLTIFCDGEEWGEVHPSIFGRKPPLPKEAASLEEFNRLFLALEYRQAKQYAARRLAAQSLPSATLRRSLQKCLVSEATIERVIQELTLLGYLNDQEWAANFARVQAARRVGPRVIARKLASKGIRGSFASEEGQKEAIQHLLQTRYRRRDLSDFREKQKVIASLMRRGFDLDAILSILE